MLSDAFDHTLAVLHDASLTAACAVSTSLVGLSWDGGAPAGGGESSVSFCPLGGGSEGFVNVIPGGFVVERGLRGGIGNDSPSEFGLQGTTILGSGLRMSTSPFDAKGPKNAAARMLLPFLLQGPGSGRESPEVRFGMGWISIDGLPPERNGPHTCEQEKLYSILKFKGPGTEDFCGGIIAKGGARFCTKKDCNFLSHQVKAWERRKMAAGFYVLDMSAQKAYLDPFLPLADGMCSQTGQTVLAGSNLTLEAWSADFRHLRDTSGEVLEPLREGDDYFEEAADTGLQRFTTAMKTPRGRGRLNPLTSPKCLRLDDRANNATSISSNNLPQGPRVMALKNALALVKGELGSQDANAPYVTVHGRLQGLWEGLGILEEDNRQQEGTLKICQDRVDNLLTDTSAVWNKGNKAVRAVEQLANIGGPAKVVALESEFSSMSQKVTELETTLKKAPMFLLYLNTYVSNLPRGAPAGSGATVPLKDFLAFKEAHTRSIAAIKQEIKGGTIVIRGITFKGEDACIAFAREHMKRDLTYHCILSMMFAMCMPSDEVIFKGDMQSDKIHMARTSRNPMQSAVILLVNTIIPAILEGPKDSIQETKHNFNARGLMRNGCPPAMLEEPARTSRTG